MSFYGAGPTTVSAEQDLVERLRKRLKRDPARADRLKIEWNKACDLLAGYIAASGKRWKVYEAHYVTERARAAMLAGIENGVPDDVLWIHALHGAGFPAAPHPKPRKRT
jgi:predicted RNase H-like nuclease (RuvC/YqgF family)